MVQGRASAAPCRPSGRLRCQQAGEALSMRSGVRVPTAQPSTCGRQRGLREPPSPTATHPTSSSRSHTRLQRNLPLVHGWKGGGRHWQQRMHRLVSQPLLRPWSGLLGGWGWGVGWGDTLAPTSSTRLPPLHSCLPSWPLSRRVTTLGLSPVPTTMRLCRGGEVNLGSSPCPCSAGCRHPAGSASSALGPAWYCYPYRTQPNPLPTSNTCFFSASTNLCAATLASTTPPLTTACSSLMLTRLQSGAHASLAR